MRVILDISTSADNRIEGTASWPNGGGPIEFSGWLALMRLVEDANAGRPGSAELSDPPEMHHPVAAGPSP